MSELLTITVEARTAAEAQEQARKWAHAEPHIRLVRITRVRPAAPAPGNAGNPERWEVELAFVAVADEQMEAGL
jgi:hypothetical protein